MANVKQYSKWNLWASSVCAVQYGIHILTNIWIFEVLAAKKWKAFQNHILPEHDLFTTVLLAPTDISFSVINSLWNLAMQSPLLGTSFDFLLFQHITVGEKNIFWGVGRKREEKRKYFSFTFNESVGAETRV